MDDINERALRAESVAVAQSVLLGGLDAIRGAWRLSRLRHGWEAEDDPDFLFMSGVASETDGFPLGPERSHWDPTALAKKDAALAEAIEGWGESVREACRRIVDRYGPTVLGPVAR